MVQPPSCTGGLSRSGGTRPRCATSGSPGASVSARFGGLVVVGCHLHPKLAPNPPSSSPAPPGGERGPGVGDPTRGGPNLPPLDPAFHSMQSWRRVKGVSRTPSISICPGSRGQISCRENIPVLSQRAAFRVRVLSFEFFAHITSLWCFLVSNEWTGSGLSFVLVWPRDVSVQSHYRLGSVQGLCHAPRSLGIFARLPFPMLCKLDQLIW